MGSCEDGLDSEMKGNRCLGPTEGLSQGCVCVCVFLTVTHAETHTADSKLVVFAKCRAVALKKFPLR